MKNLRLSLIAVLLITCISLSHTIAQSHEDVALPHVILETELGDIEVEIYVGRAPVSSANFLRYVDEERFEGASFYRVVTPDNQPKDSIKIQVIQGGLGWGETELRLPPISHETTLETGILHKDGTLSMARLQPGSADSEFFICVDAQPELDYGGMRNPDGQGFAAFAQVVRGMEIVRKIQEQDKGGQMLINPVKILTVRLLMPIR